MPQRPPRRAPRIARTAAAATFIALSGACGRATSDHAADRASDGSRPAPTKAATAALQAALATPRPADDWLAIVPALATREAVWHAALAADAPILPLTADVDAAAQRAQALAIADPRMAAAAHDAATGAPLRSEVMQIRPVVTADLTASAEACRGIDCHRVEVYNYAANVTWTAFVDVAGERVVDVRSSPATQPEIPAHLAALAVEIARAAPEVEALLGGRPEAGDAVMQGVKSALNGSRCERSQHLCVAPTFIVGDQALWAVVDLTDGRLVGTRWTDVGAANGGAAGRRRGAAGGSPVTEQSLSDEVVMATYCQSPTAVARDGWTFEHVLTPSDGLELRDVRFQGRPVMRSAKLVDWHVSYSGTDGFGYSDAIGCPKFSTASVVAFNGPSFEDIREGGDVVGFRVTQDFRSELWPGPCNYRYAQYFDLYRDGRFRVGGANLGRGCGNTGTYRPVVRIDITAGGDAAGGDDRFATWDGSAWRPWEEESWHLEDASSPVTAEGYAYRVTGGGGGGGDDVGSERAGYDIAPNRGQLGDGSRGDNAFTYVTVHRADEGDGDLLTIGPCCNADAAQGPEKFMAAPEPLDGDDLVVWIVPQLVNSNAPGAEYCWAEPAVEDGRTVARVFPCAFGPMFVPIGSGE
ncbi:MAG: hypothetical protein IPG72_08090 [Ardenticatenales bacterium]|nr:hypothetical protein [Ardenticatenales bacterium]